jgi:hypothetical protein
LRATGKYLLYTNFPSRRVGILFWLRDSHFYPYEAPGGAETFWSFTFLSIRSPWRGRGVLEFHISIHTKPLAGQRRFGVSHFYPYEAPGGAETFWSFTFLSIRSPWRGRGVLEFHISIHTKPLAGQRRFGVSHFYPYEAPGGAETFGVSHFYPYEAPGGAEAFWSFTFLSIRSPWRGRGVLEFHIISTNMTLRQVGVINPPSVEFRVKSVESVELSLFRFIVLQTAIGTITTLHPNIKK